MKSGTGPRKAQTNMILIVLLLIIFVATALFLLSLARTVSQEDYLDLYVNNLMLSLMKTDTGFSDSNCKLISDATACAFSPTTWPCGEGLTCLDLANQSISEYMDAFEMISKNYRYLFIVTSDTCSRVEEGCRAIRFGDESLEDFRGTKKTAKYVIQKRISGTRMNLIVLLYVARK
jgi:hypothetical protein